MGFSGIRNWREKKKMGKRWDFHFTVHLYLNTVHLYLNTSLQYIFLLWCSPVLQRLCTTGAHLCKTGEHQLLLMWMTKWP